MRKNIAVFVVVSICLGLLLSNVGLAAKKKAAPTGKAAAITLKTPHSIYRHVDKDGSVVGEELFKRAIPGVGVGNIIFATAPMPFDKESTYQNMGTDFTFDQIKDNFTARAYFPGQLGSLIKYVLAKNPGYKFKEKTAVMWWYPTYASGAMREAQMYDLVDDNAKTFDQNMYLVLPHASDSDFRDQNLSTIPSYDPGLHRVQVYIYLKFQSGMKKVTRVDDNGALVTEMVPTYHDFLIAYGEAKVTFAK